MHYSNDCNEYHNKKHAFLSSQTVEYIVTLLHCFTLISTLSSNKETVKLAINF